MHLFYFFIKDLLVFIEAYRNLSDDLKLAIKRILQIDM